MAGWQVTGRLKTGVAALAGAVVVSMVAPAVADAAAAERDPSTPSDSSNRAATDVQARQKTVGTPGPANAPAQQSSSPGPSSSSAPSSGFGQAPSSQPTQRKDKPPDRGAHKFSPQQRSSANSPGSASSSGPASRVGSDKPEDRDPNKVSPQIRAQAPTLDTKRRDRPNTAPAQGIPGRSGATGIPTQPLQPWVPRTPKAKAQTGTHDLAYRYRIVNGRPVDPRVQALDEDWEIWGIPVWDRDSFGGKFTSDIFLGLLDGVTGSLDALWSILNPTQWDELRDELTQIAQFAQEHPVEFAKQLASWDQWQTEPGRALGNNAFALIPGAGALAKLRTLRKALQASKGPNGDATPNPDAAQQAPDAPPPAQQPAPAPQHQPDTAGQPAPAQQPGPGQGPIPDRPDTSVAVPAPAPGKGPDGSDSTGAPNRSDDSSTDRDGAPVPAVPAQRNADNSNNNRSGTGTNDRSRTGTSQTRNAPPGRASRGTDARADHGPNSARPGDNDRAARAERDVSVSPTAPRALGLNRSIGRASHNRALQEDIAGLPRNATDIRVNQQQVNAQGQRVGINRPDLQYTVNGQRYHVEYEGLSNPRGAMHQARILANDPGAIFTLRLIP